MHSYRIYSVEFSYSNGNKLNLTPDSDDIINIITSLTSSRGKTIILSEDTEYDPDEDLNGYISRNINKETISIESIKFSKTYNVLQIESGVGNFGKYSSAKDHQGNITNLKNQSAEAERYATFFFPSEASTTAILVVETQGHLDARKRLINLLEINSECLIHEKIRISAAQLIDPEYVREFINDARSVEVSFRGRTDTSNASTDLKKVDLRFTFDRTNSSSIIREIMNKIPLWNNSQNRAAQAFNDMKTIIFSPIDDSETPLDSFSSLEEVRFKFNQKYFSVDELLGKTFSYPLDTDHPTEASWLHQITPKLQGLTRSNEISLSRWNIGDLISDLSEIVPFEPEQINEISRGA